ncbi:MAG: hypothetical protein ACT4TC_04770 [Myxococcaceae bacterium]
MHAPISRLVLLVSALCGATAAYAVDGPNPYLGQAKVFYQGLEFEKCLQRLSPAHKWNNTAEEAVEVEIYAGLCAYNLADERKASERFTAALKLDSKAALPAMTSPKITAFFRSVAIKLEKKRAPPPKPLPPLPPEPEPVTTKTAPPPPTDVPHVEPTPPPVGHNLDEPDDPGRLTPRANLDGPVRQPVTQLPAQAKPRAAVIAPAVLGGVAVVSAGVGIYFGVQARNMETRANRERFESTAADYAAAARRNSVVANVSYGVAATSAVAAVIS